MYARTIETERAPSAIGPYSQAILASSAASTLYVSGQIPLDPATGEIVGEGDVRVQTERVLDNLGEILAAAGMGFDNVVKTTIYLADLADFAAVNELYGERFGASPPARATVQVAGLPRGAQVEIDAIAVA